MNDFSDKFNLMKTILDSESYFARNKQLKKEVRNIKLIKGV